MITYSVQYIAEAQPGLRDFTYLCLGFELQAKGAMTQILSSDHTMEQI